MAKQLDEDTFRRVTMIIDRARRSGANIPTRLNDAKLIWTKDQEHQAEVSAIRGLLLEFRIWRPHEFLRIVNKDLVGCTPTEMHLAIETWLDRYLERVQTTRHV
jgi:hypothetical protein